MRSPGFALERVHRHTILKFPMRSGRTLRNELRLWPLRRAVIEHLKRAVDFQAPQRRQGMGTATRFAGTIWA